VIGDPPPFFNRGPSPLARLTFFALAAVAVMIADHRFRALDAVRLTLSVIVHPLQQVATMPGAVIQRVGDFFSSQEGLLKENRELKAQLLASSSSAQQAKLLATEQAYLLSMAEARKRFDDSGVMAEVLYAGRNPFSRKLVIDKGLTQGVKSGQPVVDSVGVVGQVTNVAPFTSEVTLLTEKDQSVPVMLVRNGLRAIAVGSGKDGTIDVPFMPVSADIQAGDLFVSSGIDGTYPPGLVVAQVTAVDKNAGFVFAKITAKPAAGVDNHRFVMVLTAPPREAAARPEARGDERRAAKERPGQKVKR
jgi:rod shape-determining protein MreC